MTDEIDAYYKFKREYTDKNGEFSAILGLPADKKGRSQVFEVSQSWWRHIY